MSDKDQFTFDDDDDGFPGTGLDNQNEPQEFNLSDEDDFPETNRDNLNESPGLDLSDNDDFPETDLNTVFSEGEYAAEKPLRNEPELMMKSAGSSRTRILLMILLLVVVGGAGAYYFMNLGSTMPPTTALPVAQTSTKFVDLPPQPGKAPAAQVKTEPAAMSASVTVPPPPPPAEPAAPAEQLETAVNSPATPAATSEEKAVAEKPKDGSSEQPDQVAVPVTEPSAAETKPASEPAPAQKNAAVTAQPDSRSADSTTSLEPSAQMAFALDAGSYLLKSNRDSLVTKIRKLGYEPLVTPVDATLDMTRLRLGTFDQDKVQEMLDFARSIEPESYSLPAGDRYVIYAGTFLESSNIDTLSQRFLEKGIKVYPEPVQVVRTLSRIRFGGFASKEEASAAARAAGGAGVKATVVKSP